MARPGRPTVEIKLHPGSQWPTLSFVLGQLCRLIGAAAGSHGRLRLRRTRGSRAIESETALDPVGGGLALPTESHQSQETRSARTDATTRSPRRAPSSRPFLCPPRLVVS